MNLGDALTLAAILVAWFVINRFVLPRMGVAT
jgi:hypothetical protein